MCPRTIVYWKFGLARFPMSFNKFKGGSFDTMSNRFVSLSNSLIPEHSKSLVCKLRLLTRVVFETESHNISWEADLKNKDKDSLIEANVRAHYFLSAGFLNVGFFD